MTLSNFSPERVGIVAGLLLLLAVFAISFSTFMRVSELANPGGLPPLISPVVEVSPTVVEPTFEVSPVVTEAVKATKAPVVTATPEPTEFVQ